MCDLTQHSIKESDLEPYVEDFTSMNYTKEITDSDWNAVILHLDIFLYNLCEHTI